ncbi:FUSC family protein [Actinoplanes bogorensis]|uniref:FUSC family protein n=1 Tax=Paractinoplanes bogorensis TaxID=1610840 RepID=A0ABS5YTM1_9ACTN|nr:aromatic acid exporter family protein [Actinoplanes bogorensis]MBU2666809.1 FUSC family protein [Actinoplanes bogorensis]
MPANPIILVALGLALCALVAALLRRTVRPAVHSGYRAMHARVRPHLPAFVQRPFAWCRDRIDGNAARSVVVAAIAAGLAWTAAGILGLAGPVIAAISATLSVQISSHASLREGAKRLVATVAAIGVAVGVWHFFGLHWWSVAVIAGCGLALGRLLLLGDGAVAVPATSLGILVAGSSVTEAFMWQRVAATALGIVVGVILSPLVGGETPLERARLKLAQLSTEIALLLGDLGAGARGGYDQDEAAGWLARSRALDEDLAGAVTAVEDLRKQARWSLMTPVAQVVPLQQTLRAMEHGVAQVNSVARSMFDAAADPSAADVPPQVGQVLTTAAEAFAAHAGLVSEPDPEAAPEHAHDVTRDAGHLDDLLADLREAPRRTLRTVRSELADTGVLVLTGSIMNDVDRMAGSLARSAPALAVGEPEPEAGIPAVSEVLPAVRRLWDKRRDRMSLMDGR